MTMNGMETRGRYLFVTVEGGGNVPPVLGLAARLVERGHSVHVLTEPCLREQVEAIGGRFTAFTRHFVRQTMTEDLIRDSEASSPVGALKRSCDNLLFGPAAIVAEETAAAVRREKIDVVVADFLCPAAIVAAEGAGVPCVVINHTPEYLPGPGKPAAGPGFLPRTDLLGKLRDGLFTRMFYRILRGYVANFNEVREKHGLAPVAGPPGLVDVYHGAERRLMTTTEEFDFPLRPSPANVRYVGPILDDPAWAAEWTNPWPASDTRPLVVVSFSTTPQNQADALQRTIDALGMLEVRGLVTLGPAMAGRHFETPENVVVIEGASHARIFPHASAVVTHAGHGTVTRALADGVPLLCMPMGRDQDDNAARVFWHGAGLRLKPRAAPRKIAAALDRLLREPGFRDRARSLGEAIRRDAAEERGVRELEDVFERAGKTGLPGALTASA